MNLSIHCNIIRFPNGMLLRLGLYGSLAWANGRLFRLTLSFYDTSGEHSGIDYRLSSVDLLLGLSHTVFHWDNTRDEDGDFSNVIWSYEDDDVSSDEYIPVEEDSPPALESAGGGGDRAEEATQDIVDFFQQFQDFDHKGHSYGDTEVS
jgi:hypothetical protein